MVWVILSGLPEGYYSECLLRVIGQIIGMILKLDVHMDNRGGGALHTWLCVLT